MMQKTLSVGMFLVVIIMITGGLLHADEATSADQILTKVRERPDGADIYSEVKLVLIDEKGRKRERNLIYLEKDFGNDEKLALYFTEPGDVRGVAFQSVNYDEKEEKEDDQWLYLPAFRQVRRISATDKRGAFMGSEFAYIDLDKLRVHDYKQKTIGQERVLGKECYIVERLPVSEKIIGKTGYYKAVAWVDRDTHLVLKQTYYDAKDVLFKEMNVVRMEKIQNIWTVMQADMTDYVSKKASSLIFNNVKYDVGLSDSLFQQASMKRGVAGGNLSTIRQ